MYPAADVSRRPNGAVHSVDRLRGSGRHAGAIRERNHHRPGRRLVPAGICLDAHGDQAR